MNKIIKNIGLGMASLLVCATAFAQQQAPALVNITPVAADYFIPQRFEGKTILITGAARGIGKATAIRASREGANVIIADWLKKEGRETAEEINQAGGRALFVYTDVRSTKDTYNMVAQAVKKFGGLDYAVNNAGIMSHMVFALTLLIWLPPKRI